jgi:hypothetical protein
VRKCASGLGEAVLGDRVHIAVFARGADAPSFIERLAKTARNRRRRLLSRQGLRPGTTLNRGCRRRRTSRWTMLETLSQAPLATVEGRTLHGAGRGAPAGLPSSRPVHQRRAWRARESRRSSAFGRARELRRRCTGDAAMFAAGPRLREEVGVRFPDTSTTSAPSSTPTSRNPPSRS